MLKVGKLDSELLKEIVFDKITFRRPEVKVRPSIGEDCAIVDFGPYDCVMSTDPITAAVSEIGSLAIHITCNDIASNGVKPIGIMLAAMLPIGTTEEDIATIMEDAGKTAASLEVEIIGGHTEITGAVNQPVIVSTAVGKTHRTVENSLENIKPGDFLLLTKKAAIEGTGIIALDRAEELKDILTPEELKYAQSLLREVSVVAEGVIAGQIGTHGMHDVTEGGVLGAIWEMCQVGGTGASVLSENIPVDPVTVKIAEHFNIDYLRLISSGSMLIAVDPSRKDVMIEKIQRAGIEVNIIGKITEKETGIIMSKFGRISDIEPPEADELYKAIK